MTDARGDSGQVRAGQAGPWYHDAVIYELDVETFQDGNADGIGDFVGLTRRLPYLVDLGVDTLWLMPVFATPNRDNGYDVSDYREIDPRLGTLGDFRVFLREADRRGLRVLLDVPLNHTSDQHPWFVSANADRHSPYRDHYVWRDDPPPPTDPRDTAFGELQGGNWTYSPLTRSWYYHTFYPFQPDLNTANARVREELSGVLDFWLREGVAGFRLDAVPFLIHKDGVNAPFDFLSLLCGAARACRPDVVLLGEADVQPHEFVPYFRPGPQAGLDLLLNFHGCAHVFLALAQRSARPLLRAWSELPEAPFGHRWANFLRNNDELNLQHVRPEEREVVYAAFAPQEHMRIFGRGVRRRLAPMLDGDRARIELAMSLLLTLPGTPVILYGDEIGLGENLALSERNSARTSMQWSDAPGGGFSQVPHGEQERPVVQGGPFGFGRVNVEAQQDDPSSLLNWTRRALRARRACVQFGRSPRWHPLESGHPDVLVHTAVDGEAQAWAVHNLGPHERTLDALSAQLSRAGQVFPDAREVNLLVGGRVRVGPFGYGWFRRGRRGVAPGS